ncbi:Outer membrane efflux protein [Nitrosomonas marina]|uniref:Outer membrane efflux protein n=1 Tax=Nitrosomonas marina TaxID=917 RepID=A0A1I0CDI0_9PROT|nr:TolC family protein [Nitrosomonas marina]SET17617.1 Outer membrane efflux protein [Nitrosomonas marina]
MSVVIRILMFLVIGVTGCNLMPGGPGQIDLPYDDAVSRLRQQSLDDALIAEPTTIDQGLENIRQRKPTEKSEPPHVVQTFEQDIMPLSIEDLRLMVLHNNLDLQVSLLDPEIARTRVSAEEGVFDVLIGGRFAYRHRNTPRIDGPLVDFTSANSALDGQIVKLTELDQRRELIDMDIGLEIPLPTGGTISVGGLLSQKDIKEPQRFDQVLAATRFSFSQPLLRNAGTETSFASIRIARVGQRVSQVRTNLAALRVLAGAEKAYWRLYAARRFLDVRTDQYRIAFENLEMVRQRVAQGLSPRVEITRSELGVYERLEALINAETAWRLGQRDLKVHLNSNHLPLRGRPMIEATAKPRLAGLDLDADALVERALKERLELIELELQIVRDGIEIGFRENQILPIANLDFRYGTLERGNSFGTAWESLSDFNNPDFRAGITFEMPLTNQRRRAQLDEAMLIRTQRLASKQSRELMVRREVLDAIDVIERNWQRVLAARQNVLVAGVNYDAERRQFQQGMRTMREVLEALTELGQAQIREINAIVDYQVAQIDLAFASGTLLGYARVDFDPLELPSPTIR